MRVHSAHGNADVGYCERSRQGRGQTWDMSHEQFSMPSLKGVSCSMGERGTRQSAHDSTAIGLGRVTGAAGGVQQAKTECDRPVRVGRGEQQGDTGSSSNSRGSPEPKRQKADKYMGVQCSAASSPCASVRCFISRFDSTCT